jgi:predicted nucleotidyltransferase
MASIEAELSVLMGGRKYDLRTAPELSCYFRDQVLREAQVQYVTG